ncbi:MAG: PIG-L family deacetylase [Lacunisphaera sp.]
MFHLSRRGRLGLLGIIIASGGAIGRAASDLPTPASIAQELNTFQSMGTVLHIAAHPDDENTQLITYLSRGRGYRTGYLSITRGDGGQNELGPDFDEKLGVARTQELLAARRLDGGQQFFTRAIDFGYSKTPEETLRFWNHDEVLSDVVRVIREFRPDVIVTRFPIPPGSGGHGHHTASAMLAVEAFKLAGDPTAFPEQLAQGLTVWQPKRVLWNIFGNGRSNGGLTGPTVTMDIGGKDPVTNEAFGTIANRSRGMHKTQGLGGLSTQTGDGPNVQTFMLLAGEPATKDIMDGVDTTWNREPGGAEIIKLIGKAKSKFRADDPSGMVPALLDVRTKLTALPSNGLIVAKRKQLDHLLQDCLGLHVDSTVEHAEIVPGESFKLHYAITLDASNVNVRRIAVRCAALSKLDLGEPTVMDLVGGTAVTGDFTATLRADAPLTQPYWLREDWNAGVFRVDNPELIGRPESPAAVTLEHVFEINKQEMVITDEPVQVIQNAQGEHDRRIDVISPVSLRFDSEVTLFKPGEKRQVIIELNAARPELRGTVHLEIPADWQVEPANRKFHLSAVGEKASYGFMVTAPGQPASVRFTAVAEIGGKTYAKSRQEIRYAHIPLQLLQPPARTHAVSFELATRGHRIGYLAGAGDSVASCLEQMGYSVKKMTADDLTPERLPIFDTVVIGVRAFNERPDLASHISDLLTYVENGGTVVAQYNRPNNLKTTTLAPYPLSIQGPAPQLRVTDEKSPVTFLAPNNPALNTPNKITAADFENWVQERGAYFPSSWDEGHFESLLAFNDPGEAPLKSGILVAKYGKGYYVYTSLAFFRQLPAGVPGAYRLFANLVSLGK